MTTNMTPLESTSTLISAMHGLNIGIVILDTNHQVVQINGIANRWLGSNCNQGTCLSDSWLREHNISLRDIDSQSVAASALLTRPSLSCCIDTAQQKTWVSAQSSESQWQNEAVIILLLTDISQVVEPYIQLKNQTASAALFDADTKLYNRQYALDRMQQMHNHGKRYGGEFAIALINIDQFKRVNDTYGQNFGDNVIKQVAKSLKQAFRETDFCARYSGEEFLVLMPEISMMDAVITLDRLRQRISEIKWEKMKQPITISAGVHLWQRNKSVEQLLFETDKRLSMAKSAGRNQVCGDLS